MSSRWQSPWNAADRKATKKMLLSWLRTASTSSIVSALAIPLSCLVYMLSSSWAPLMQYHDPRHLRGLSTLFTGTLWPELKQGCQISRANFLYIPHSRPA
ncbi:cnnm4 [Symbiodinium natans]|uniref:Cnnm4 protein n=1 Tax=Symbiodinium natans TaxID=878477 RepID=A0A812M9Z0_9DINO|nr:cnnm4 [Symbiodinium natans]